MRRPENVCGGGDAELVLVKRVGISENLIN